MVAGPDAAGPLTRRSGLAAAPSLRGALPVAQSFQSALPTALCARWLAALGDDGNDGSRPITRFDATTCAGWLDAVAASALGPAIVARLGPAPRCNLSHSFLRHGRPPHHWHQDGALRLDFIAHDRQPLPADALLEMLTCWIALTPCGEHAPGLEWVDAPLPSLLRPHELTDDAVLARFGRSCRVRPVLQAGDALLFDGSLLHRTHLTPSMPALRTSVEMRFFRAGPAPLRLAGCQWAVPAGWSAG